MLDALALPMHDEQAALVATGERRLRDAVGGKSEVVVAGARPALGGVGDTTYSTIITLLVRCMRRFATRSSTSTVTAYSPALRPLASTVR